MEVRGVTLNGKEHFFGGAIHFGDDETIPEGYREQVKVTEDQPVELPLLDEADYKRIVEAVSGDMQKAFEAERDRIVQEAIEAVVGDVCGVVDAENTVTLSGDLPAGTYTFKLRMSDGSTVTIGTAVKS